ncbi:MAG: NAD-dependent epimerase/dehydratase family protein [Bacteroidota bacterium]
MKVILTGNGFLGKVIVEHFKREDITVLGRTSGNIICDLANEIPQLEPADLVIHTAGKAHSVPKNIKEGKVFFDVNVQGTANLLKGLEFATAIPKNFVLVSTVAVYGLDKGCNISEDNPLAALDPYGKSKIEAEKIVSEWCIKHNVICTILRLPLVAGANPKGNLATMIKGISNGYYFNIDGGRARKSIVLARDVAEIILRASSIGGIYNLTDGHHPSFKELAQHISTQLFKSNPLNMPMIIARLLAVIGDFLGAKSPINTQKLKKITSDLTFSDSVARKSFGWNPTPVLADFKIE